LGAEVALAFAAGLASFALVSLAVIAGDSDALVILIVVVSIAALGAMFRFWGAEYAVPAALAAVLAFDWFYVPPTHAHAFPDAESLANLFAAVAVGVLVGELAAHAGRRADVSELARSELADEQVAVRRVATLVAEGVAAPQLMAAVAKEAGMLLGVDGAWIEYYEGDEVVTAAKWSKPGKDPPTFDRARLDEAPVAAAVRRTGRAARIDDSEDVQPRSVLARRTGKVSLVGAPISVEGAQWGLLLVWSQDSPLPDHADQQLTHFTDLVATAIANSDARTAANRLGDEQAALRRMATLVASEPAPDVVFAAVAEEVNRFLGAENSLVFRYSTDGTAALVAAGGEAEVGVPIGTRLTMEGDSVAARVLKTGQPARLDDFANATGSIAALARNVGVRSAVGSPILVEGRIWGAMVVLSRQTEPLPKGTESGIGEFTELVATAIANTEARAEVGRLAEEQAALRRVATLVAEGVPAPEMFAAVARELGQLLGVDSTALARYEPDGMVTGVGVWSADGNYPPLVLRVPLDDTTVTGMVNKTGRPARLDGYGQGSGNVAEIVKRLGIRSSVGAPITVDGRPWGVMIASSNRPEPLAADTEARIAAFTDLVATAISNTEARTETRRLADEQAALRRVATLAAEAVPSSDLFHAVAAEVGTLLGTELATLFRYEDEDTVRMLSIWTADGAGLETLETWKVEELGLSRTTAEDNWPGRVDDWTQFSGPLAHFVRDDAGVTSSVSSPIVVEGQLWGGLAVHTTQDQQLPPDTEGHLEEFTELVATAIANTQAQSELSASRARIVVATDEERRRVVRDLHDGAQQRLVHTVVTLQMANRALEHEDEEASPLLAEALQHAEEATGELRELAHGILPSVLTRGGLRAGVDALASRMQVPVENGVSVERLAPEVEATAYFVVAEALTNVVKHSRADRAAVSAKVESGEFHIEVRDDGIGGARAAGTGLVGLADRVAALDGTLRVESPPDGGTLLAADIPVS
jgi:signal transduction histidine kinase